jgi:type IV pilus assembly protein PilC
MSASTAAGAPLADAMARHPQLFRKEDVALIRASEQSDGLPELFFELAEFARADQQLVDRCREAVAYPCVVIFFAFGVFGFVFTMVIPRFSRAFYDFSDGAALPPPTQAMIRTSELLIDGGPILGVIFALCAILALWGFGRGRSAYAASMWIVQRMPGAFGVMRETDYTRLCRLWHLYLRRGIPMVDAIAHTRRLLTGGPLSKSLADWERAAKQGRDLAETLRSTGADGLLAITISRGKESHFATLTEMYEARAEAARRNLVLVWSAVAGTAMGLATLAVTVAMFSPLIRMIGTLGALS